MTAAAPAPIDPELEALAEALTAAEDSWLQRPLAWWRAWHREPPRTSQRAVLALVAEHRTVIVLGGNRTGKTELMRAVLLALALGSDHPDAAEFWRANGVDPRAFPPDPGRVWVIALTSADSVRIHRRKVLQLIPRWGPRHAESAGAGLPYHHRNLTGKGEASIEVMCPGYREPAEIWFKSEDQGDDAMQGDACRGILHDEEGKTPKTWDEADVRLWDYDGWHIMSNTPKSGITWVYHRFVSPPPPKDDDEEDLGEEARVVYLHSVDNPHIDKRRLRRMLRGDAATVAARTEGKFVVLGDRWWPEFSPQLHVLPAEVVGLLPEDTVRFRAIDFGTRDPFACLWAAYTKHAIVLPSGRRIPEGSLIIYREHYRAEWTIPQHVDVIRRAEGWVRPSEAPTDARLERVGWVRDGVTGWVRVAGTGERIECTWVDPEDAQQRLQLIREHEFDALPAIKARRAGHDAVAEELHPDITGEPRLYVVDTCANTIREVEGYVRSERGEGSERGQVDAPVGRDDHTCDCLRYLVMGVRGWRGM